MNTIEFKIQDGKMVIKTIERIDSSNASLVEQEIFSVLDDHEVIIDASKLEYISSAGLRVILKVRKEKPTLKIIEVSNEVYEIFEMTGFSEMIDVEKVYRQISVEGCEVIGKGANGLVYRIDPDTIVKVYMNPDSLEDIKNERNLARKAFVAGLPTAISYDVAKVGDKYGSVFELLNADSFASLLDKDLEHIDKYVDLYVDLLKKINGTFVKEGELPSIKENGISWAKVVYNQFPKDKADKLVKLFEDVEDGLNMIHGDYHVKNVMLQNGEVLLIDMDTLSRGNIAFELAAMYNAYEGFYLDENKPYDNFLGINFDVVTEFWIKVQKKYFGVEDLSLVEDKINKFRLIGQTRVMRRLIKHNALETEEGRHSVEVYKDSLLKLIDKVDSLDL